MLKLSHFLKFDRFKQVLSKRVGIRPLHSVGYSDAGTGAHLSSSEYASHYRKGDEILGFTVQEVSEVSELHLTALRLQHRSTGADYLHVARNDLNNVFSVAFRTPPPDSTGICHILEHLALCGSQTYPCRDPFFKMLTRSLSTFMNAFTGNDYTMYPFSTQNFHDFNNLMQVYLDAAFFPLLREMDFHQEGWRLEFENPEDNTSPVIIKGVVFNEMKGMFASSAYNFYVHQLNSMLPSHTYRFKSGGDPLIIPDLSWNQLKEFHKVHYHPSNARFFSYGTFPLESHLSNVDNWILSKFSKIPTGTVIPLEPRWKQPREDKIKCSPDPMAPNPEKQTTFSVSYLLDSIENTYETFCLAILSNLLIDGPSSPFYKSLLLPGIGADYSPGSGIDPTNQQSIFSIGLTGIHENDINSVKEIIEETFNQVIKDGFPQERIEAMLHSVELGSKHQTENFGLSLIMSVNSAWNHGANPITSFEINKHVNWFKEQLAKDPNFLQNKIVQYFKNNNHKLSLTMKSDETFTKENEERELKVVQLKVKDLTSDDKSKIFLDGKELANFQRKSSDGSCLPTLLIAEVNPTIETFETKETVIENVPVFTFRQPTNGILYFRTILNTSEIPDDLQPFLPLFCSALTQMGAGNLDFIQQDQEINLRTGGLSANVHISQKPNTNDTIEQGILLSSHCLERNAAHMFALWLDIFKKLALTDEQRLAQLIQLNSSELVQNLPFEGHAYAMRYANSNLNASSALTELFAGMTHVTHQKKLAELDNYREIISKLKQIGEIVLNKNGMRCALHTTPGHELESTALIGNFLSSLPGSESPNKFTYHQKQSSYSPRSTHFVMPFPVNYMAKGYPTVPFGHSDYAPLLIMSKLVSSKYLHREIREVGGAYRSGVSLNQAGIWTFFSYRDPNVENTFKSFSSSIDWLVNGQFTELEVDEAKLKTFSDNDKPVAPGNKGLSLFINGITDQQRQQHKDNLFLVSKAQLKEIAEKYLAGNTKFGEAVLGPKNDFTSSNSWKVIHENN